MTEGIVNALSTAHENSEKLENRIVLVEDARKWASDYERERREPLNREVGDRLVGRTYHNERLTEIHKELEESNINVNGGLVKWAAAETVRNIAQDHVEQLDDLYEGFDDELVDFATSAREELEDTHYDLDDASEYILEVMVGMVYHEMDSKFSPYDINEIDGAEELSAFFEREEEVLDEIKDTSAPSNQEIISRHYPEVPNRAYENFGELFESEGPIETTTQARIRDYQN